MIMSRWRDTVKSVDSSPAEASLSLPLLRVLCFWFFSWPWGSAVIATVVSSGLGRKKKLAAPNLLQRIEDNKKKEKNKQKRGKVLRRILGTLFRMETVSRGSLLFSRPQNYSPVSISPMLSLSDAALTEKPRRLGSARTIFCFFFFLPEVTVSNRCCCC